MSGPVRAITPSWSQEGIWLAARAANQGDALHVAAGYRLAWRPGVAVLRDSIRAAQRRHPALAVRFAQQDGELTAFVDHRARTPALLVTNGEADGSSTARQRAAVQAMIGEPFDLGSGPLWRVHLRRTGDGGSLFVVVAHEAIVDPWSLRRLARELLYECSPGRAGTQPEPEYAFVRHALRERAAERACDFAKLVTDWASRIGDLSGRLPDDLARRPDDLGRRADDLGRRADDLARARCLTVPLTRRKWQGIGRLAAALGSGHADILLTGFLHALSRYHDEGTAAVAVLLPFATDPPPPGAVGRFAHTVIARSPAHNTPTVAAAVCEVSRQLRECANGTALPAELLARRLGAGRHWGQPAFTPFAFSFVDDDPPEAAGPAAVRVHPVHAEPGACEYPIALRCYGGASPRLSLVYRTDLCDKGAMRGVRALLTDTLDLLSNPAVAGLPFHARLALSGEDARLIAACATGPVERRPDAGIHHLIERAAHSHPDLAAVLADSCQLSYGELNRRSEALARRLTRWGARRGAIVVVCLPRSAELVIALLGVLKAGCAYLPADESFPARWLDTVVSDAAPVLAITSPGRGAGLAERGIVTLSVGDTPENECPGMPSSPPRPASADLSPSPARADVAYVLYTSGSTGTPKGVQVEHAGVVNHALWRQRLLGMRPGLRVLQSMPATFDPSVWELLGALAAGATLVLARPDGNKDPRYLAELIRSERVAILQTGGPAHLRLLLDTQEFRGCTSLRHVWVGGDVLPTGVQRDFAKALPHAVLHNTLGATEATIEYIDWPCPADVLWPNPLGRPIANAGVRILDATLRPCPVGVIGVIHVSGPGVARGYLGRPASTARAFIADPFGPPGSRLFRTEDLGRWRRDGTLEFIGRGDQQVKLRGYRIDLAGVDACIGRHPAVREALTAVAGSGAGARLVCCIVRQPGDNTPRSAITEYLRTLLPGHMIPGEFTVVDELPRTATGKPDRGAVAVLGAPGQLAGPATFEVPGNSGIENQLSEIWQDLLGTDQFAAYQNFFEVGGNSLLAAHLANRVSEKFQQPIALRTVYEAPTIAEQAQLLRQAAQDPR